MPKTKGRQRTDEDHEVPIFRARKIDENIMVLAPFSMNLEDLSTHFRGKEPM
jgi:hypothetical protein